MRTTAGLTAITGIVLAASLLMAGRANAQNLTLKQEGGSVYLVEGKARLQIPNAATPDTSAAVFHLPDGDTVTLAGDSVQVQTKTGQSGAISLKETLKQWVHDDSKWNGHALKNYILGVYEHGGLFVGLENAVIFDGALLAILTTNSASGSGNVIESQQIVKIQTTPTPVLQMVRFLPVPSTSAYAMPPTIPRLFLHGKSLLLFTDPGSPEDYEALSKPKTAPRSHLAEIDTDGKTLRTAAEFPRPLYPVGLVNNRWLVLGLTLITHPSTVPQLWLHDIQRHITLPLPVASKDYEGFNFVSLPDPGCPMPYMALQTHDGTGQKPGKVLVLHLPDGRRVALLPGFRTTGCSVLFWNNQVVTVDTFLHRIAVYEAQTGRVMKTFALPAALKAGREGNN